MEMDTATDRNILEYESPRPAGKSGGIFWSLAFVALLLAPVVFAILSR